MDRRQQKTRKAIFDAFIRLLEQKSFGNITVQEIIDEANIGRSTFYAHFETKDELLRAMCTEIFEHVFSDRQEKERTHDFSAGGGTIDAEITHVLYHLQDNRRYIKGILSSESGDLFMRYFKEYLTTMFESAGIAQHPDIPQDYITNLLICDFAETVRWWMRNERYSPEEISRFFRSVPPFWEAQKQQWNLSAGE